MKPLLPFLIMMLLGGSVSAARSKILAGHVPEVVSHLTAIATLPATNVLHLAIGLPLRNQADLDSFLGRLYDPTSPDYRHYLSPEQFTERYGPTIADYQKVTAFARQHNLTIRGKHANRLVVDVDGSVADIQQALHVTFKVYHHPTEARDFYSPDTEPMVDGDLPIAHISGLDNLRLPRPRIHQLANSAAGANVVPKVGSGPAGTYMGNDFRAAYLPGVTLTGTGQTLGLLEFSGYYASDIALYDSKAGLAAVPLQNISVGGYGGAATSEGDIEVSTDIEIAESMAPGLAKIAVFDAGPNGSPVDILEAMVASNSISQFSCSWGWGGGPNSTVDSLFEQMMAQGQSFFNASGDSDAFTTGATSTNGVDNTSLGNAPSSCPYITQVGGTTLTTTGPGGAWSAEAVWNWGSVEVGPNVYEYLGSSGGISSYYSIPTWQAGVSMSANGGSPYYRNIPDVAANADNIYVVYDGGQTTTNSGGTSCAAPLWAALAALMNEQAVAAGRPTIGLINSAIYTLGNGTAHATGFHDITSGNNKWSGSPSEFSAVTGYDLCTGWGSPAGQGLINAVAGFEALTVSPTNGFSATGFAGGPFSTNSELLKLTNGGNSSLSWAVVNLPSWLTATPTSGSLAGLANTTVSIALNAAANALPVGTYSSSLTVTDLTSHAGHNLSFALQIGEPLVVLPTNGLSASGQVGGPFVLSATNFTLTNVGSASLNWTLGARPTWLTLTPASGTLSGGHGTTVTASLSASDKTLPGGVYAFSLAIGDALGQTTQYFPLVLNVGQSIVQNGGFEAGTFTNWTLVGNTVGGGVTYNAVESTSSSYPEVVHSGNYGAFLGDSILATLSQNVATVPGQTYLFSFWLINPTSGAGEQFLVNWITNTASASQIYYVTNPPVLGWTNLTFVLQATGTNTELQFGSENVPNYFGLDDVSLIPIPNPAVYSLTRSGTLVSMTVNSVPGINYQLLYATNLTQTTWIPISTNTATTTTLTITNSPGTNHLRFYRIRQLP